MQGEKRIDDSRQHLAVCWTKAQPIVMSFILSVVRDYQHAEDLLQEVAVTAALKFDTYDRTRPFHSWAIGIARNKVRDYFKARARDRHVFTEQVVECVAKAYQTEDVQFDQIKSALRVCLEKLQGRTRNIVRMRYLDQVKPSGIAEQFGMTRNAVFVALHRARTALGQCVRRRMAAQENKR